MRKLPKAHSASPSLQPIYPTARRPTARPRCELAWSKRSVGGVGRRLRPGLTASDIEEATMSMFRTIWGALVVMCTATAIASIPASAQQGQKPNILFIMGDDIGWMQPSIYHRGLMVGETPNIDRIGN